MYCFHHNDPDGRAAGAIVNKFFKENYPAKRRIFVEVDYDIQDSLQKEIEQIQESECVYVVDFHFNPKVMEEICKRTSRVFVFDHHKTAPEVCGQYPSNVACVLNPESKFSGCELVWKGLFPEKEMPEAIKLIGDRDAWKWNYGQKTAQFNEGLKLYNYSPESTIWDSMFKNISELTPLIILQGDYCLSYRDNICKETLNQYGYEAEFEGLNCYVVNFLFPGCGSEMFSDKIDKYDMCIGMMWNGDVWKFSLRSNGKVDVSEIAKKYSGGGHSRASGFYYPEIPFIKKG